MDKIWKRGIIAYLVACVFIILLCGCEKQTEMQEVGKPDLPKIMVGCDDYSPFSYVDVNGEETGIDVELAKEAFGRMGYEPQFVTINWEEKKQLLKERKIDCIWSSYSMTGREQDYHWAGPYMESHQVIVVDPKSSIYTLQDLEGKTVAVQSTTKPEDIFRSHDSNIPIPENVLSVQKRDLLFAFLSKGYVEAIAMHDTAADQFMQDYDMKYRILDEPLQTVGLGVAFDLDDERRLDLELSRTLSEMRADGTVQKIVGKYLQDTKRYLGDGNDG